MYCEKCGCPIPGGSNICPSCGAVKENAQSFNAQPTDNGIYTNSPIGNNGTYYTPPMPENNGYNQSYTNQYDNYFNQGAVNNSPEGYEKELDNSKTLGIIAIIIGILVSRIAGIVVGAIGLSKANSTPDFLDLPLYMQKKKDAKLMNKLGIIIPIVLFVIALIAFIFFTIITAIGAASALGAY